jgi:Fe-S oxidoreductase
MLQRAAGLTTKRRMPPFARQTFRAWFAARPPGDLDAAPVVLFADTFNDHFHPEVAKSAVAVLEAAGRRVIVPERSLCCGRPLYDYGMLELAGRHLDRLVDGLRPYIREGVPVVGLEPSCTAVFRDELVGMRPHDEDAKRLSLQTLTLAEYLEQHAGGWKPPPLRGNAILHGHCHQKAVIGLEPDQRLLEAMGLDVEALDAGCCGLAGSFGFEAAHHELSLAIGERRLLPAVRAAGDDTLIVNDGFSCKTQIAHGTDRRALHLAQVIELALDRGSAGVPGGRPERAYPDLRR